MTETQLVRLCIDYLLTKGHYVWRNNTGLTRKDYVSKSGIRSQRVWRAGVRGSSDVLGIAKNGRFIAVECKVGKNKTSEYQDEFLDKIKSRGGYAIIAYDLDDLQKGGL